MLNKIIDNLKVNQPFKVSTMQKNLWALAEFKILNNELMLKFDQISEKYINDLTETDLVIMFDCYSELNYSFPNKNVLSSLL